MNIDEIKVRLSNLDTGKVVKYDHAMNLATQFMLDYKNDVTYLLSIIEQTEKDLVRIYNVESLCERDSLLHALTEVNHIADEALKAIRGN